MQVVSKIGENAHTFDIEPDHNNENLFFMTIGNKRLKVEIIELKPDSITVSIDNRVRFFELSREQWVIKEVATTTRIYPVEVKTPQQEELERVLASYESTESKSTKNEIRSPMPGKILEIFVKPGERVELGQIVAILEAMKMENEITSVIDGVAKEVKVAIGDSVAIDQVLIQF